MKMAAVMTDARTTKETLLNVAKNLTSLNGRNLSSYAKIMLALEMAKTSLVQSAGRDPLTSRLTRIEREKTKISNVFYKNAPHFDESLSNISGTLGELAKSKPDDYTNMATRFGGAKQEIEKVTQGRKNLAEKVTTYISRKDQVSAEIRNAQKSGKSMTELKAMLDDLEKTQRLLVKGIKDLMREEKQTLKTIYSLHLDVFNALPPDKRVTTTPPKAARQLR